MKGKKAKKKTKGKKGAKDREWTHEGGTGLTADRDSTQGSERPQYRVTQERDEKNRRVRFKQELLRQKKSVARKLSHKLTFRDILPCASSPEAASSSSATSKEERPRLSAPPSSTMDVAQRLRMMLVRSSHDNEIRAETESENGSEEADSEVQTSDGPDEPPSEATAAGFQSKDMTTEGGVPDLAVEDEEDCSEDEEEARRAGDAFKQFFEYDWRRIPVDKPRQSLLATVEGLEVYGALNPDIALLPRVKLLKDIPGLPKLWRSRKNESLSPLSASLMPFLVSYSDMLFEAATAETEEAVLRSMTLHCLVHVLRAR